MSTSRATRSRRKSSLALPWTIVASLMALGLVIWRSNAGHDRSMNAKPTFATADGAEPTDFDVLRPGGATDGRLNAGTDTRSYELEVDLVDPGNPGSSSIREPWSARLRRGGLGGTVESVSSRSPRVQGASGERFEWIHLEVNGQQARPTAPEFVLGDETVLSVRAYLLLDGFVRVVDAATGRDLPIVDVILAQQEEGRFLLPPGYGSRANVTRRAASPLEMPAARGRATYWLGAPGHAWRRITYSGAEGGTPVHALEAGCSLALRRKGDAGRYADVIVSLIYPGRGAAEEPFATTELPAGSDLNFEGLPPGDVLARFTIRAGDTPEFVIHEETLRLEPRNDRTFELDLATYWTPPGFASLELLLDVTAEGDLDAYELALAPVGLRAPVTLRKSVSSLRREGHGLRVWSADSLLAGRYQITVTPSGCSAEVELAVGEARFLELTLAAAPKLRLWCVDTSNGAPVEPDLIVFRRASAASADSWREAPIRGADGAFLVRTEEGPIELGVRASGFLTARSIVDVRPGENDAVVELVPSQGIELRVVLRCEDAELPISTEDWARVRLVDPGGHDSIQGVRVGTGTDDSGCCLESPVATFIVGAPGEYELHFEPPRQFRGPVSKSVRLEATGADLAIDIERFPFGARY